MKKAELIYIFWNFSNIIVKLPLYLANIIYMKKTLFVFLVSSLFIYTSCKKQAGFGGNASIRGNVHAQRYNSTFTALLSEYNAKDYDVYIIPEGYVSPEERVRTNYEGNFEFRYLYPGKYTIYAYSKDSVILGGQDVAVRKEIEITKNNERVNADTLVIFE